VSPTYRQQIFQQWKTNTRDAIPSCENVVPTIRHPVPIWQKVVPTTGDAG